MSSLRCSLSALLIVSLLLTGCWDRRELEERSLVTAIAIDSVPEGYKITFQVPIPIKIAGSGGSTGEGGQDVVQIFSSTGTTISEAFGKIRREVNQELFFGYTVLLLLGEDVLKTGIERDLDLFRRDPQVRRRLIPVVVKGKAGQVLHANPKLEQIPSSYIYLLLENGIREGWMADVTLGDLFANLSDPSRNGVVNMLDIKNDVVRWIGLAVLKGDRMVGRLSDVESVPAIQLRDQKAGNFIEVPCPGGKGSFVFRALRVNPKVKIDNKEKIRIKSTVHVIGEIIENGCKNNLSDQKGTSEIFQLGKKSYMSKYARNLLHKMQKELKSDIFFYGERIRALHPQLWREIDWKTTFPKVKVEVEYQVEIRRYGMESR